MKTLFLCTLLGLMFLIKTPYFASAQIGTMPYRMGQGPKTTPSATKEELMPSLMKYCLQFAQQYPAGKLGDAWHLCTHPEKERSFFESQSDIFLNHHNCVFTVRHRPSGSMASIHAKIKWHESYQPAKASHNFSDIVPVNKMTWSQVRDYFFNIERAIMKVLGTKPLCTS